MKKFFTLIFVIYTSIIFSQNWNLLNSNESYHYKISNVDFYTNTILTDSIYSVGLDSFLFMNTICKPCDTCSVLGTYIAYQPQFLNKIVKKENSGWYHFYLPDTFHINSLAQINDTWIYKIKNTDTTYASIISLDTIKIFSINDSIKTILLSSGDTIVFSKNHGLLAFNNDTINYSLIGLENSNLGFVLPTNKDFYNFNVGDSFFYYGGIGTSGSTSPYENYDKYKKVFILSKVITDTSIIYNTYFVIKMSPSYLGTFTGYETLTYKTNLPKYNIYNNKLLLEYNNIDAYIHKILLINNINNVYIFYKRTIKVRYNSREYFYCATRILCSK